MRFQQQAGGRIFTNERFAFLDESTKKAVETFTPSLLPSGARTDRQKLKGESALFERSIGKMRESIDAALSRATAISARAPSGPNGGLPPPPQVNLPSMNFGVGPEFSGIVDAIFQKYQAAYQADIANLRGVVTAAIAGADGARRRMPGRMWSSLDGYLRGVAARVREDIVNPAATVSALI